MYIMYYTLYTMVQYLIVPMLLAFHFSFNPNPYQIKNKRLVTPRIIKITREEELQELRALNNFMNHTNYDISKLD